MNPEEMTLVLRDWETVDFNYALASISWLCGAHKSATHTIDLLTTGTISPAHSPLIHCYLL
jgi:alkanesulfonate monooxygenase SsuD/methylene tetrahydromethanopterin reductase-like flavin-dependent oxidoreductase (luciferase family)